MLVLLLALQLVAKPAAPACVQIEGDRILAKHAAELEPVFKTVSPETVLSFGPSVGSKRIVSKRELERWAARFGLTLPIKIQNDEMCFERAAHPLSRGEIEAAIRRSLPAGKTYELNWWRSRNFRCRRGFSSFRFPGLCRLPSLGQTILSFGTDN